MTARCKGELPLQSLDSFAAPDSRRSCATAACPLAAARWRAVRCLLSLALTSVPTLDASSATSSRSPRSLASLKAVPLACSSDSSPLANAFFRSLPDECLTIPAFALRRRTSARTRCRQFRRHRLQRRVKRYGQFSLSFAHVQLWKRGCPAWPSHLESVTRESSAASSGAASTWSSGANEMKCPALVFFADRAPEKPMTWKVREWSRCLYADRNAGLRYSNAACPFRS
ncbi:hypothetical protein DFJ74DRAFT_287335 [Hyaloraphidium curvatum]|nr:hypothetical protein DFJ74DRAFT_287335 [Hyaloraphidium curvatum]